MRHRGWLALVILMLLATSGTAAAQPAGRQDAEQRHRRGLELLEAKDFAAAAIEFAAAHRLDPQPRYLFNLALAQRRSGRCKDAIQNYQAFLATTPPPERAASARSGIQLCEATLAPDGSNNAEARYQRGRQLLDAGDATGAEAELAAAYQLDPQPRFLLPLAHARRQLGRCDAAAESYRAFLTSRPAEPEAGEARRGLAQCRPEPPAPGAPPLVAERAPWPRRLDVVVGSVGAVTTVAAVVFFVSARSEAGATFDPGTVDEYRDHKRAAEGMQTLAWIATGATVGVAVFEVVRYLRRPTVVRPCRGAECKRITIAPVTGGGVVGVGGAL